MIPKFLHQMWIGEKPRPEKLMNTWRDKNPSCVYLLWTDQNLKWFPFQNTWQRDNTPEFSGKCDIMRFEILYRYGGIFIDADSECVNELDDFFFENDRFTCYDNELALSEGFLAPDLINPAFMGCQQGDQLFGKICSEIGKMTTIDQPAWVKTGPVMFTNVQKKWQKEFPMKIYPSWYFIGTAHGNGTNYTGTDKVYSKHYYGSAYDLYGTLK